MSARKLPEIAACPCPKRCGAHVSEAMSTGYYLVRSECGFAGPTGKTPRAAIELWNRRASDAEAERRGAMAVIRWLERKQVWPAARHEIAAAIDSGEVLPAAKKGRTRA